MKLGSKTHLCDGSRGKGKKAFGRLVNLYVRKEREWVKIGEICSNCGDHWINGKACSAPRSNGKKPNGIRTNAN